jgi:hypothetical protein
MRYRLFACVLMTAMWCLSAVEASAQSASGVRNLPDIYTPGETITVTIDLTVTGTPLNVGVAESFPSAAWEFVSATPTPDLVQDEGLGWFFAGTTANGVQITYTVRAPADATGPQNFDGVVTAVTMTGSMPSFITGDTVVNPEGQTNDYAVTAGRTLPSFYQTNVSLEVTLQLTVNTTKADSCQVTEVLPDVEFVEFLSANPAPTLFSSELNTIQWTFSGSDVQNRTITYQVRPKPEANTALLFAGTVTSILADNPEAERIIQGDFLVPFQAGPTPTATQEPSPTAIPTQEPTPTAIPTQDPSPTPTITITATATPTPTPVPTGDLVVARDLPNAYRVGENVTYSLAVDIIASNVRQLAILERIPSGWTPVSADPQWANFDASENRLIWNFGPATAPEDTIIAVTVAPAADSAGPKVFAGALEYTVMEGIVPQVKSGVVTGDTIILPDASQPGPVTIVRSLPAGYTPGTNVSVSLAVNVDEAAPPTSLTIQEAFPTDWTLVSSTPPHSSVNLPSGLVIWNLGSGSPLADQTIQYVVQPPLTASGIYPFAGGFEYNAGGLPLVGFITGDATITDTHTPPTPQALIRGLLGKDPLPNGADFNQDGVVDITDVILSLL